MPPCLPLLPTPLRRLFRPPHPVLQENRRRFARFSQAHPIETYEYLVVDTELTGLNRRQDEIVAIGAVRVRDLRIVLADTFYTLVRPGNLQPSEATLVHRLTPEALAAAPPAEEVLPEFVEFCGRSLLVGHCLPLDMHFLNRAARRHLGGTLSNPGIDTMRLARGFKRTRRAYDYGAAELSGSLNLADLADEFGLVTFPAHNALDDALQAAYLFLFLVEHFQERGVRTLRQLYQAGRIWPLT